MGKNWDFQSRSAYTKYIAKIIHIVDIDGVYIPDENVIPLSSEHERHDGIYYCGEAGIMETPSIENTRSRNKQKRMNLDYLLSMQDQKIKIGSKLIPYEIYYFSSNMDHFINNDANLKRGKRALADKFLRSHLSTPLFCKYFLEDEDSLGKKGYWESWDEIRKGTNSIRALSLFLWDEPFLTVSEVLCPGPPQVPSALRASVLPGGPWEHRRRAHGLGTALSIRSSCTDFWMHP